MNTERILKMGLVPFDTGVIADEMEHIYCDAETQRTRFVLFLRYLKRFTKECGVDIAVPEYAHVPFGARKEYYDSQSPDWNYTEFKRAVLTDLLAQTMTKCGWKGGVIKRKWGRDSLAAFADGTTSDNELMCRYAAVSKNPLFPPNDELSTVYLCWNERIYEYDRFMSMHEDLVDKVYGKESRLISRLLRRIADPFAAEIGTEFCCYGKKDYQMVFYEGWHENYNVGIFNMDYNFYIYMVVVEMLIREAERTFGYLAEKEVAI